MIFLDTGYILASVNPKDELHGRARAWMKVLSEPLVITEYVVWEAVNALSQPPERSKAQAVAKRLADADDCEWIPADSELFDAGMALHAKRPDKAWSLTDCISFIVMERKGIRRALSYDRHFEQAGSEALLRMDPP